jgi:hypothetical protein
VDFEVIPHYLDEDQATLEEYQSHRKNKVIALKDEVLIVVRK